MTLESASDDAFLKKYPHCNLSSPEFNFPPPKFQKPLLVRDAGTIQIAGSRMGPIGFLVGEVDSISDGHILVTNWKVSPRTG